jgi:hypothetical protein
MDDDNNTGPKCELLEQANVRTLPAGGEGR